MYTSPNCSDLNEMQNGLGHLEKVQNEYEKKRKNQGIENVRNFSNLEFRSGKVSTLIKMCLHVEGTKLLVMMYLLGTRQKCIEYCR